MSGIRVRSAGGSILRRHFALIALVALLLPTAAPAALGLVLPVFVDNQVDFAILAPFDPRSDELIARDGPDAARHLWDGRLASSGASVRFVEMGDTGLALVGGPSGLAWYTLEEGSLVAFRGELPVLPVDIELQAPAPHSPNVVFGGGEGILQVALDGDDSFRRTFTSNAQTEQLAIISLVDAIYAESIQIPIEVVSQHVWQTPAPLTGSIECSGASNDLLEQTRVHYESTDPTTSSARESLIMFTTKAPRPHPLGGTLIGCAYIEALESSYAYATVRVRGTLASTPLDGMLNVVLTAHELGHNFGGHHHRATPTPGEIADVTGCYGATIMYPYLCNNSPAFSDGGMSLSVREVNMQLPYTPLYQVLDEAGVVQDGGNRVYMNAHAMWRI